MFVYFIDANEVLILITNYFIIILNTPLIPRSFWYLNNTVCPCRVEVETGVTVHLFH